MSNSHVFISHSSKDDGFVRTLREALESLGLSVWADSRKLSGGDMLTTAVEKAIEDARQVIVVVSLNAINSDWVQKEIEKALAVGRLGKEGYKVIPLLMPGIEPPTLRLLFEEEPVGVRVEDKPGGLSEALPQILEALGERLPDDRQSIQEPEALMVAELKLRLKDARFEEVGEGKRRVSALAQLIYDPAEAARPAADSREFRFRAPLGPIEADDLRWYLESYYTWPTGVFTERAKRIEGKLPDWGEELYEAATAARSARDLLSDWQKAADDVERRFSIFVDSRLPEGSSDDEQAAANEAGSALLSLPWELMHDGRSFLFQGRNPVRVRRCLPKERAERAIESGLPIRIVLVSPRPEDERAAYIDHRLSARPLVEAVESLGELAQLTILYPPTFPALQEALRKASEKGEPFDVIHFDGHGVYNRERGLGVFCFEDPRDGDKTEKRASQLVDAEKLAAQMRDHRVPLVFLEACQSAAEEKPNASVAAKLLDEGVTSVVAMTHSVLVETARRFVTTFYRELAEGKRIGTAMLAGQHALYDDDFRFRVMGAGDLRLQDWFVPVLYQEENDPRLITSLLPERVKILHADTRRLSLGALPDPPAHGFIGRSRELLKLERLLRTETAPELSYAVVRGQGGEGKTTLGVELARWLVRTNRFRRAAFVSLEQYTDARGVLIQLGQQLLPGGDKFYVGPDEDIKKALQPVERALRDRPTLIVLDNLESVLPDASGQTPPAAAPFTEFASLFQSLLRAHPATRILFTTREPLPSPFDHTHREVSLHALSREDAIELVSQVMKQNDLEPKYDDAGNTPQEIIDLVEAVNSHARALVLLAREVSTRGVRATTENLQQLMSDLDKKHPGDRENSLYASVELSLRRLPPGMREQIKALAPFHGGTHLVVFGNMLGIDEATTRSIAERLTEVGLAGETSYDHLRLDLALPAYLLKEMSEAEQEEVKSRWAREMTQLAVFLYEQQSNNAELARRLTLLELPNLMAVLSWMQDKGSPEVVVELAQGVESLVSLLGRPQALAQAERIREQAARQLVEWSHAQWLAEGAKIDRLLERGDLLSAHPLAQRLLQRCLAAGEEAYPEAAYDIALAYIRLGRVLSYRGAAEAALPLHVEAQRRIQVLADAGEGEAEHFASLCLHEMGGCLRDLGRLDEAAAVYREAIELSEKRQSMRDVATTKNELGTTRILQRRYGEALEILAEARDIFESLGEPTMVAAAWHQMGTAYTGDEQFEPAEQAYRQSLALDVRQKNLGGEAHTLGSLGNLYNATGRCEEAVRCYQQAAEIHAKLQDQRYEGADHKNMARALINLRRYDEARRELLRAIECDKPYGHVAHPWNTWSLLHNLEGATGDPEAAARARQQAINSYLSYRRAGGESVTGKWKLCLMVAQAIGQGGAIALEEGLDQFSGEHATSSLRLFVSKLQAILLGERNPALAEDPNLDFDASAELQLLLEELAAN